jgi:hypothetical protein
VLTAEGKAVFGEASAMDEAALSVVRRLDAGTELSGKPAYMNPRGIATNVARMVQPSGRHAKLGSPGTYSDSVPKLLVGSGSSRCLHDDDRRSSCPANRVECEQFSGSLAAYWIIVPAVRGSCRAIHHNVQQAACTRLERLYRPMQSRSAATPPMSLGDAF